MADRAPSAEEISAVQGRCEQTYHTITALHDMCEQAIGSTVIDSSTLLVLLCATMRGIARDMEVCAETLDNNPGGLGCFAAHYGSV